MLNWLKENWTTLAVVLALVLITALIIVKMIRDRRTGRSSCGCGCSTCPMSGSCQRKKTE